MKMVFIDLHGKCLQAGLGQFEVVAARGSASMARGV
jgi:hypothetical protein